MSGAIPWALLHEQFKRDSTYEEEITKLIVSPEDVSLYEVSLCYLLKLWFKTIMHVCIAFLTAV